MGLQDLGIARVFTGGRTQAANLDLLENDAAVTAWIARAIVGM